MALRGKVTKLPTTYNPPGVSESGLVVGVGGVMGGYKWGIMSSENYAELCGHFQGTCKILRGPELPDSIFDENMFSGLFKMC